MNIVRFP